jgi:Tfp pilus assembly protein PilX
MNKNIKKSQKNAGGFILVLVLFTVMILATLTIGLLNLTAVDASLTKNYKYSMQAYYIAEAGIADAIGRIRLEGFDEVKGDQWQSTFPTSTSNTYSVDVDDDSNAIIKSTGTVASANFSRTIEARANITGAAAPYNVSITQWKEKTD